MADITIRGAGIFGLSVAWACAKRGARVQVVDPNGPAAGSSGGIVGALAPHVPENWNTKKAFQLDSLLMAEKFWTEVEQTGGGASGYARHGRLQPIQDDNALVLALQRAGTAEALWQEKALWQVVRTTASPWKPASATGWLIHDTLSALIHPRKACQALVKGLAAKGVHVAVEAPDRGHVLWATGVAGLETLNKGHHRLIGSGVKGQAALLEHNAAGQPQLFTGGVHIVPHLDGTVAVGSTSESDYATATETDDQLDTIIACVRAAVPALKDARILQRWAGIRPRSRSRAPMLGAWPDKPGHFIANGGFKIGFGMAPKVANVMADLILEGRDEIPDGFRVEDSL